MKTRLEARQSLCLLSSGTRRRGAARRKPKPPVSPLAIYVSTLQLTGNGNVSQEQQEEGLSKSLFRMAEEKPEYVTLPAPREENLLTLGMIKTGPYAVTSSTALSPPDKRGQSLLLVFIFDTTKSLQYVCEKEDDLRAVDFQSALKHNTFLYSIQGFFKIKNTSYKNLRLFSRITQTTPQIHHKTICFVRWSHEMIVSYTYQIVHFNFLRTRKIC